MAGFGKRSGPTPETKLPNPFESLRQSSAPSTSFQLTREPNVADRVPTAFQNPTPANRPLFPVAVQRPIESPPRWGDGQRFLLDDYDAQPHPRPIASMSLVARRSSETSVSAKIAQFPDLKRNRSPTNFSRNEDTLKFSTQTSHQSNSDFVVNNHGHSFSPVTQPLSSALGKDFRSEFGNAQRPVLSQSSKPGNHAEFASNLPNLLARHNQSSVASHVDPYTPIKRPVSEVTNVQAPKGIQFSSRESIRAFNAEHPQFARNDSRSEPIVEFPSKLSTSPPRMGASSNFLLNRPDSQINPRSLPMQNNNAANLDKINSSIVSKRTRSPPPTLQDKALPANFSNNQDDNEREMQAKAKRLARFKLELSEPVETRLTDTSDKKISANKHQRLMEETRKLGDYGMEPAGDFVERNASSEFEGTETSSVIVGLCPDMCPESERGERERKGDLDQYERLGGDRNQTSELLAVKKYTRTAEREASLIRPMPVLQMTIDYLISLLDQPYDNRFLGMYNFLWDRMRAVRMDLRMQHIFDKGAISMLEQMIRLHIIAMHELCEYTKGEGFSEGFDAHLNIEQMNKTSVELFQMYDDHRKKGINVPTEKEFRGYYALLKLDKHPGYKVEPAELSLDLAKMTSEIRQTPEVLFARNVARACRTGNYVAFFKLARGASYLQACLMHAHFAKLRTQALASLHSSLHSQGLPVNLVARWLGMEEEEEEIENIIEYHGFSLKDFKEPYMIKEGPFLNADSAYPTKRSRLVNLKKSKAISEDVLSPSQMVSLPTQPSKEKQHRRIRKHEPRESLLEADEEMSDHVVVSSSKDHTQVQSSPMTSTVDHTSQDGNHNINASLPWGFPIAQNFPQPQPVIVEVKEKANDVLFKVSPKQKVVFGMEDMPSQSISRAPFPVRSPSDKYNNSLKSSVPQTVGADKLKSQPDRLPSGKFNSASEIVVPETMAASPFKSPLKRIPSGKYDYPVESSVLEPVAVCEMEDEPPDTSQEIETDEIMENYHKEVADAKLRLMLRLWRRRSAKLRELRLQRHLAAEAALNSLSLGPPIQNNKDRMQVEELDYDHVMRDRYEKHERSWSRINVSDVVAGILEQRNPDAKCLCWKVVLFSYVNEPQGNRFSQKSQLADGAGSSWLFSKLIPFKEEADHDLIASNPGMSIWKKWFSSQSGNEFDDLTCCLSVVKEAKADNLKETVLGASAVLYLVSESIPWKLQKAQLCNLLMSIPSGSCLPLLILCDSSNGEVPVSSSTVVNELSLHDLDKSRVSSFSVIFLAGNQHTEKPDVCFSDEQLRKGLQWLASESPLQPTLQNIKLRELVMSQLVPSLERLESVSGNEVGPNHCISSFNNALDWSLGVITAAAKANHSNWPCPEIELLEDSSDERLVVTWYLPSVGWSSTAVIRPLECLLRDCKLPSFPDDMSWLRRGASVVQDIQNQRIELENCLIRYLTQSSKMMRDPLATDEASVMLQRSTRLELRNLSYYIVPNWVMIFRRIFNWRLMSLSSGTFSSAYVLEIHLADNLVELDKLHLEDSSPLYLLNQPSLDEAIEVGCSPLKSTWGEPETPAPQPETQSNGKAQERAIISVSMEEVEDSSQRGKQIIAEDVPYFTSSVGNHNGQISAASGEYEKFNKLLEDCNMIQNSIDSKLSIYF